MCAAHPVPCVMTDTDQFYVGLCPCGTVHLNFGPLILNATPQTVIAISETLKEVSAELRRKLNSDADWSDPENATLDLAGNVIKGRFVPYLS